MNKLSELIAKVLELDAQATPVEWNAWVITKILEEAARPAKINEFDSALIAHYRTAAPKLAKVCEILWNDLPNDEALAEIEKILGDQ